jgi:hypothetical protein
MSCSSFGMSMTSELSRFYADTTVWVFLDVTGAPSLTLQLRAAPQQTCCL